MTTNQKIVFDDAVLAKIAGKTASEVDGVLSLQGNLIDDLSNRLRDEVPPTTGVNVDLDADQRAVSIELTVVLAYGKDANAIFNRIAKKITEAVEEMTGYHVKDLKLTVKDMLTAAEWQAKQADKHPEPEPPKPPEPKPEPETKPDPAPDPPKPDPAPEPPKPDEP